jgi:hypothetical protein
MLLTQWELDELVDRVNAFGDPSGENPRAVVEVEERAQALRERPLAARMAEPVSPRVDESAAAGTEA